jgi:nucleotide-binding universal stress UspA family protein
MTLALPSVLCPVDFSEPSRSALAYAAAIADHFGARLTVLSVDDPLLADVASSTGQIPSLADVTLQELERVCRETLINYKAGPKKVGFRVAVGKPAVEILHEATAMRADLIVLSSHGRSGLRKLFFGSITERVLRETTIPVLVTPDAKPTSSSLSEIASHINRIIVPVDLTGGAADHLKVAGGLAEAISVPLIVAHVLEPIFVPYHVRLAIPGAEASRRAETWENLSQLARQISPRVHVEPIVLTGEPSEEIVSLAAARQARLIVMGLHSSGLLGPRMGSVTYRVLCRTTSLVLALPPGSVSQGGNAIAGSSMHAEAP